MHLTLKLKNTKEDRTFIVGCNSIDIRVNGSGYHVRAFKEEDSIEEFYVGSDEYDIAYVENFNGATTHIIKPKVPK